MQKQLRIITSRRISVNPFDASLSLIPPCFPSMAFSKHIGRLHVHYRPLPGVRVYYFKVFSLYVWCFPSGRRQLNALPF